MRLAVAGAAVFVAACVLVPEGLRSTALYSDVHAYSTYAHDMLHGRIPYRDFFDEYPPLAQPVFLAARSVLAFKVLMTLCGVGIVALLALVFRSPLAVAVFAVSPVLVGPIFLNAYDLWPTFLLVLALALVVRRRPVWGLGVLGLAVAAKIYPIAVLPLAFLQMERAARRSAAYAFVGALAVTHLPFAALGPGGLRFSYQVQAERGLELNSLGSALMLATGRRALRNQPPGSLNVVGGTAHAVATLSAVAVVVAIVLATWLYLRGRLSFVLASATAVVGFVAFDKVFSAQYVEWLAPLAPLGGVVASALTTVVLLLTRFVFSHRSGLANQQDLAWLLARDLAVVALFALLLFTRRATTLRTRS